MNTLELAKKAQDYYDASIPKNVDSSDRRYILVHGHLGGCLFVPGDYAPDLGEYVFKCQRVNGNTSVELKQHAK